MIGLIDASLHHKAKEESITHQIKKHKNKYGSNFRWDRETETERGRERGKRKREIKHQRVCLIALGVFVDQWWKSILTCSSNDN